MSNKTTPSVQPSAAEIVASKLEAKDPKELTGEQRQFIENVRGRPAKTKQEREKTKRMVKESEDNYSADLEQEREKTNLSVLEKMKEKYLAERERIKEKHLAELERINEKDLADKKKIKEKYLADQKRLADLKKSKDDYQNNLVRVALGGGTTPPKQKEQRVIASGKRKSASAGKRATSKPSTDKRSAGTGPAGKASAAKASAGKRSAPKNSSTGKPPRPTSKQGTRGTSSLNKKKAATASVDLVKAGSSIAKATLLQNYHPFAELGDSGNDVPQHFENFAYENLVPALAKILEENPNHLILLSKQMEVEQDTKTPVEFFSVYLLPPNCGMPAYLDKKLANAIQYNSAFEEHKARIVPMEHCELKWQHLKDLCYPPGTRRKDPVLVELSKSPEFDRVRVLSTIKARGRSDPLPTDVEKAEAGLTSVLDMRSSRFPGFITRVNVAVQLQNETVDTFTYDSSRVGPSRTKDVNGEACEKNSPGPLFCMKKARELLDASPAITEHMCSTEYPSLGDQAVEQYIHDAIEEEVERNLEDANNAEPAEHEVAGGVAEEFEKCSMEDRKAILRKYSVEHLTLAEVYRKAIEDACAEDATNMETLCNELRHKQGITDAIDSMRVIKIFPSNIQKVLEDQADGPDKFASNPQVEPYGPVDILDIWDGHHTNFDGTPLAEANVESQDQPLSVTDDDDDE